MMKKIALTTAIALAGLAHAAQYDIDPPHTNVHFAIDHFGTSTNRAAVHNLEGSLQLDKEAQSGSIDISIPLKNLTSGNAAFDKHLHSGDIFDVEKHPELRFVSDAFHFKDGKVESVEGKLTLKGQTHPVTLKAERFNCYENPMKKVEVCGGDFSAKLDRTQWGVDYLVDAGMTKEVDIVIQIEAAKK